MNRRIGEIFLGPLHRSLRLGQVSEHCWKGSHERAARSKKVLGGSETPIRKASKASHNGQHPFHVNRSTLPRDSIPPASSSLSSLKFRQHVVVLAAVRVRARWIVLAYGPAALRRRNLCSRRLENLRTACAMRSTWSIQ